MPHPDFCIVFSARNIRSRMQFGIGYRLPDKSAQIKL